MEDNTFNPGQVKDAFRLKIKENAIVSVDAFYDVFDPSPGVETSFVRGNWDFFHHIALPLTPWIKSPENLKILEIGYGGGRLLLCASRMFQFAYGVDIHDESQKVASELKARGATNFELIQSKESDIDISPGTIDVVYSFIVFQHLGKCEIFKNYISEISKVLKPGGIGVLYFARFSRFSFDRSTSLLHFFDNVFQYIAMPKGYKEMLVQSPTDNSLYLTDYYVKKELKKNGLMPIRKIVSRRKVPDGAHQYGGQHGWIIRKPE